MYIITLVVCVCVTVDLLLIIWYHTITINTFRKFVG